MFDPSALFDSHGIHSDEYPCARILAFFHYFVLARLATISIRVKSVPVLL